MSPSEYRDDPAYAEGFYDAQEGEPLFPDAAPAYAAGWRGFQNVKAILASGDLRPQADGSFGATLTLSPTPRGEG